MINPRTFVNRPCSRWFLVTPGAIGVGEDTSGRWGKSKGVGVVDTSFPYSRKPVVGNLSLKSNAYLTKNQGKHTVVCNCWDEITPVGVNGSNRTQVSAKWKSKGNCPPVGKAGITPCLWPRESMASSGCPSLWGCASWRDFRNLAPRHPQLLSFQGLTAETSTRSVHRVDIGYSSVT